jgi:DNA-binding NarL/FixJ family response regulator
LLLADDHAMLRAGTRRILEDEPDLRVVAEASNGEETILLAEQTRPDVVVLDISMPGTDGVAACIELRRRVPDARVLILTVYQNSAYVRALHRLGAAGYLLKSASAGELIAAIRRVHGGALAYDDHLVHQLERSATPGSEPTARELAVIREMARGHTNRTIGETLGVTENTVEFHVRNLYLKLHATSRTDAVLIAQRLGWLDSLEPLC